MYKIFIICVTFFVQNRDFLSLFVQVSAVALWGGETNMITGQLIEFHTISIVLLVLYDSLEKTSGKVYSLEHYCICTQCTVHTKLPCHSFIKKILNIQMHTIIFLLNAPSYWVVHYYWQHWANFGKEYDWKRKRCFSVRQAYKKHIFLGLFQKFLWNS